MNAPAPYPVVPGVIFQQKVIDGETGHPWLVLAGPKDGKFLGVNFTDARHGKAGCHTYTPTEVSCLSKASCLALARVREFGEKLLGIELASEASYSVRCSVTPAILAVARLEFSKSGDIRPASLKAKYGL